MYYKYTRKLRIYNGGGMIYINKGRFFIKGAEEEIFKQ